MKRPIYTWFSLFRRLGMLGRYKSNAHRQPQQRHNLEPLEPRRFFAVDLSVISPVTANEDQTATIQGWYSTGSDASLSPTLIVSWGDGNSGSFVFALSPSACTSYSVDHIYADGGSYIASLQFSDDTGSDAETVSVQISGGSASTSTSIDYGPSLAFSSGATLSIGQSFSPGSFGHQESSETVTLQIN